MPPVQVRAPGRVNLIGEHTDYSDGWCLPVAIDRGCRVTATPNADGVVRATSAELPGRVTVDGDGTIEPDAPRWGRFVAGAVRVLRAEGHAVPGVDLAVHSTVPAGAGLYGSANSSGFITGSGEPTEVITISAPARFQPAVRCG